MAQRASSHNQEFVFATGQKLPLLHFIAAMEGLSRQVASPDALVENKFQCKGGGLDVHFIIDIKGDPQ